MIGTEAQVLPTGQVVRMGCKLPAVSRFSAVPAWAERNPVLPESEWQEHDDFAPIAPPIKHQDFSNCTNASLAGLVELLTRAQGGEPVSLSQVMLYWLCNDGADQGAMCRDVVSRLLDTGLCTDALCPQTRPVGRPTAEMLADAGTRKALEVYQCLTFEDVASALTRRFLVYHGFVLGNSFFGTHGDGIVPAFDGSLANGHAMYSRGLRHISGVWRTATPNSWGTTFGAGGVGYIDRSYFWAQRGNFTNLDCYAVRALDMGGDGIPQPKA